MTDLPIGSLWRSRINGDIRIIVDVGVANSSGSQYLIDFYDTHSARMMCTVASASAWTYHWRLIAK